MSERIFDHRVLTPDDFEVIWQFCCEPYGKESSERRALQAQYMAVVTPESFQGLIVTSKDNSPLGVFAATFILPWFANYLEVTKEAFFHDHVRRFRADGKRVFPNREEIVLLNSGSGLDLFILNCDCAPGLSPQAKATIRHRLKLQFIETFGGWNVDRVYAETGEPILAAMLEDSGLRPINFFSRFGPPDSTLYRITRGEAIHTSNVTTLQFLDWSPPQCGFSSEEQETILCAIRGMTDPETAKVLVVQLETLKKRWKKIYAKFDHVFPGLLPQGDETRGQEKRRKVIQFLRHHLNELRPYKPNLVHSKFVA